MASFFVPFPARTLTSTIKIDPHKMIRNENYPFSISNRKVD